MSSRYYTYIELCKLENKNETKAKNAKKMTIFSLKLTFLSGFSLILIILF